MILRAAAIYSVLNGTKYSRIDQEKFVEDRPHHLKFFNGCLPQILPGPFLNTLPQIIHFTMTSNVAESVNAPFPSFQRKTFLKNQKPNKKKKNVFLLSVLFAHSHSLEHLKNQSSGFERILE